MSRTGAILIALCSFAGSLFAQASAAADSARDQQAQPVRLSSHDYAGDETCSSCHTQQANAFLHTAHHLTSQLADRNSIAGSFREGTNLLRTSNPELFFKMEANERGLFQTAISGTPPDTSSRSERFDLVVGSGGKGQTYLYWRGEELFQLPVTYWTELQQWVNSPGYKDGIADFSRRIPPRCLDCHATYFESLSPPLNRYRKDGFKLGIACEKCHGAGREHVAEETSKKPIATISMVNPRKLSRERQMDLCALCHAGIGEIIGTPFSYTPGTPLDEYVRLPRVDPKADIDVHGSQVELLRRSRCYQSNEKMTCSTCHEVHVDQHDLSAYSARCLTCHQVHDCRLYPKLGRDIASNCIDCHMPLQQTNLIVSDSNGKKVKPRVRNHWIKVYAERDSWSAAQ